MFAPAPKEEIPLKGELGVVIAPNPEISVQFPLPVTGEFPAKVAVAEQINWFTPALELVGLGSTVMVTSENEAAQGEAEMVQRKIDVPTANPEIVVVGEVGVLIVPLPEISVHKPVPETAALAFIAAVVEQIV